MVPDINKKKDFSKQFYKQALDIINEKTNKKWKENVKNLDKIK